MGISFLQKGIPVFFLINTAFLYRHDVTLLYMVAYICLYSQKNMSADSPKTVPATRSVVYLARRLARHACNGVGLSSRLVSTETSSKVQQLSKVPSNTVNIKVFWHWLSQGFSKRHFPPTCF